MSMSAGSRFSAVGLLVLALCLPLFFLSFDWGANAQAWRQSMNLVHFFFFAALSLCALGFLHGRPSGYAHTKVLLLAVVVMLLIEWLQPMLGRSASLNDLWYGLAGSVWIILVDALYKKRRRLVLLISLVVLAVAMFDTAKAWSAVALRALHFPVLAGFENPLEATSWRPYGNAEAVFIRHEEGIPGTGFLRLSTSTAQWSGVVYQAGDMDWSGYGVLRIQIYNPGPAVQLGVRIDDTRPSPQYGERLNLWLKIAPGANDLRLDLRSLIAKLPQGAQFDIGKIRKILLFVGQQPRPRTIYIDNLVLEKT